MYSAHAVPAEVPYRSQVLSVHALSPSRLGRVQLMVALLRDEVDIAEVVSLVTRDPALSMRLLLATNSAATGLRHRVSSVHEAVMMLGVGQVRQWVSLMALSDLIDGDEAQIALAVTRARMCQIVAERAGLKSDAAFTVGLLDRVATLLGLGADKLCEQLPLAPEVADALVTGAGGLGDVLRQIRAYEDGEAAELGSVFLSAVGFSTSALHRIER